MFKSLLLKLLASKFLKGKITFSGLAISALPVLQELLGVTITSDDVNTVVSAVGILITLFGAARKAFHEAVHKEKVDGASS